MKLKIGNFAKIKEADIELNGITVIGGDNNTGKNTVGKVLFCLHLAMQDVDQKVETERIQEIARIYIPVEYCKQLKVPDLPYSNDALYISKDNTWYFIEFKNGSIDTAELYRKFYDSILILLEMGIIPNLQFAREHIVFILVYNSNVYPKEQRSQGREQVFGFIRNRAKEEQKLFRIYRFENYLCKETHTYSKEIFQEKFTEPMEKEELA